MDEVARPDLLARFDRLGMTAAAFARRFPGLPGDLLAAMRQGKYRSARAEPIVARLEAAVAEVELEKAAAVAPTLRLVPGAGADENRVVKDEKTERELVGAIEAAKDPAQLRELQRTILAMRAQDLVTDNFVRVATDSINRQVQIWEKELEAQERARAGEPLEVRVTYVNRWKE